MPFSNDQYRGIRDHLERLLVEAGLFGVLEEAAGVARAEARPGENLRDSTVAYLRAIISGLSRRSRRTYERASGLAQEFIQTESGKPISDLSVVATPEDRDFLGFEEISLSDAPDVTGLLVDLEEIALDLERE